MSVLCGLDRLPMVAKMLHGKRVGLITTSAALDAHFVSSVDRLSRVCKLTALFAPEHGIRGELAAGVPFEGYTDPCTGLPVYSLYRKGGEHMEPGMLEGLDALVYDVPDVGLRYYTYLSTLQYAMRACGEAGRPLVVLDRPNPLGDGVEGNVLRQGFESFVGAHSICVRYGLTVGELAQMLRSETESPCELTIIPCRGWRRHMLFPDTGRFWAPPSPAIPRFESALAYGATCLMEGTNLSEGRGSALPFEQIGAPYLRPMELVKRMNGLRLPGVRFLPVWFTPYGSKHGGRLCGGVRLAVVDVRAFRPVETGVRLLFAIRQDYEKDFAFLQREDGAYFLDFLAGDDCLTRPGAEADAVLEAFEKDSAAFARRKRAYHLYQ